MHYAGPHCTATGHFGLSDTALANWHKRHRHLRDPVFQAIQTFHDTITINRNNKPGISPVRKKKKKNFARTVMLERYSNMEEDDNQAN